MRPTVIGRLLHAFGVARVGVLRDATIQLLLDTAMDAVVIMFADGSIADFNHNAEALFGWPREDAVGQSMAEMIIPERYRERHRKGIEIYLETGEGPLLRKRIMVSALKRSGEEFPVELSICPVRSGGQTIFIGFIRDPLEGFRAKVAA